MMAVMAVTLMTIVVMVTMIITMRVKWHVIVIAVSIVMMMVMTMPTVVAIAIVVIAGVSRCRCDPTGHNKRGRKNEPTTDGAAHKGRLRMLRRELVAKLIGVS